MVQGTFDEDEGTIEFWLYREWDDDVAKTPWVHYIIDATWAESMRFYYDHNWNTWYFQRKANGVTKTLNCGSANKIPKETWTHVMLTWSITDDEIKEELLRRKRILEWMVEKEIFEYKEVGNVVALYYSNPERVIDVALSEER